jgi:CHAD domain-containing protein
VTRRLESFSEGAARLSAAADVIRKGLDPEGVHQLRVTSRRLRVGLELAGYHTLGDDLRTLTRDFGLYRDLDVLLAARRLPHGLRRWAARKQEVLRPPALARLDGARFRGIVRALRVLPPPMPEECLEAMPRWERRVAKAARRFEKASLPTEADPDGISLATLAEAPALIRAHALRRRLRALRYAREWAGLETRLLAQAQKEFGVLSDATLLMRCSLAWAAEGGRVPKRFEAKIARRLIEALGPARARWQDVDRTLRSAER